MGPIHYTSDEEDSSRWWRFPFRTDDIVISARSKSGTTWVQMICALLIFRTPALPEPLPRLSPWLDWLVEPFDDVLGRLDAQRHRRFIKTHTPLDGIPTQPGVSYVVVGRHPLDMAVSLHHQSRNIDREAVARLTRTPVGPMRQTKPLDEWLSDWIEWDGAHEQNLDSLPGVMWHLSDAWSRRHRPDVLLVHYDDLLSDLGREMRRIADRLEIDGPHDWAVLEAAARFDSMQERADDLVPTSVLRDARSFFRRGASGAGREVLSDAALERYSARASSLAPPDLLAWLHRE